METAREDKCATKFSFMQHTHWQTLQQHTHLLFCWLRLSPEKCFLIRDVTLLNFWITNKVLSYSIQSSNQIVSFIWSSNLILITIGKCAYLYDSFRILHADCTKSDMRLKQFDNFHPVHSGHYILEHTVIQTARNFWINTITGNKMFRHDIQQWVLFGAI